MSIDNHGYVLIVITLLVMIGCERRMAAPVASPPAAEAEPGAGRPRSRAAGPRIVTTCLDVYSECEGIIGLPALSGDGKRVALADLGPDSERDERALSIRIVEIDQLGGHRVVETLPVVTVEDYALAAEPTGGEIPEEARASVDRRARAAEGALQSGGYGPLLDLGTVHPDHPMGDDVDGLSAHFDGHTLRVLDRRSTRGGPRWQRTVGPSRQKEQGHGEACGSLPVAEIRVWASRQPSVVVAQVRYIGSDACSIDPEYLFLR